MVFFGDFFSCIFGITILSLFQKVVEWELDRVYCGRFCGIVDIAILIW